MSDLGQLCCADDGQRRRATRAAELNGIDYVEVDEQRGEVGLRVVFIGRAPDRFGIPGRSHRPGDGDDGDDGPRFGFVLEGGRRITDLELGLPCLERARHPDDDIVAIPLDGEGDFTTYRLRLVELDTDGRVLPATPTGFDPHYTSAPVRFRIDCDTRFDCLDDEDNDDCHLSPAAEPSPAGPDIDYLAKDYASFRRLILDRLATTMPAWKDRQVPDVWLTVAEMLAYVGDHLSYEQDAVATEAYLLTARQRVSVRRHLRLLDHRLHEGCNARAWVTVQVPVPVATADLAFTTAPASGATGASTPSVEVGHDGAYFAPVRAQWQPDELLPERNRFELYTWGGTECHLPVGATTASLLAPPAVDGDVLGPGDRLILEQLADPVTGEAADADPDHRHVVRLEEVSGIDDPVTGQRVLVVRWGDDDALPFPLFLAATTTPACLHDEHLAVAWGNVVLVDHGRPRVELLDDPLSLPPAAACPTGCCDDPAEPVAERYRPGLAAAGLTHAQPVIDTGPSAGLLHQNPREAMAALTVDQTIDGVTRSWHPVADLLRSGPTDRHLVVETDDEGAATLRFGDGSAGLPPTPHDLLPPGSEATVVARHRIGNGPDGNVGAEAIVQAMVIRPVSWSGTVTVRNPLPASGGTAPETVAAARRSAPHDVRRELARAVLPADYAEAVTARFGARVQRAAASRRSTGAATEILVAVDPFGSVDPDIALLAEIASHLDGLRMMHHRVRVVGASYVPLRVRLVVCLDRDAVRGHVRDHLAGLLGSGVMADGRRGLFHPDERSFGTPVYRSRLLSEVLAVSGVASVASLAVSRLHDEPDPAVERIELAPPEIARLDDDRNDPTTGFVELELEGGR